MYICVKYARTYDTLFNATKSQLLYFSKVNIIDNVQSVLIGYEPADLTVHHPPPRTAEGGFIFFV